MQSAKGRRRRGAEQTSSNLDEILASTNESSLGSPETSSRVRSHSFYFKLGPFSFSVELLASSQSEQSFHLQTHFQTI